MSLLDVLRPATPPEPKGARVVLRDPTPFGDPATRHQRYRAQNRERINAARRERYARKVKR